MTPADHTHASNSYPAAEADPSPPLPTQTAWALGDSARRSEASMADAGSSAMSQGRVARIRAALLRLRAHVTTSAWAGLAGRALVFSLGLLVLAWIGRAATAAPASVAGANVDGGAGPLTLTSASPPPPPLADAPPVASQIALSPSPAQTSSPSSRTRATPSDPVYVNHASADELRRLPGAGPKRAEAIVALRQRMGRFQRVEDLLRVKGIGRSTLRKWRPLLRLDAPTTDAGAP
ncbi:MAG TPA: ComEA family DNA-binding protein [Labilithrix sp.]|nr:ComEA family DNA-binding protein [Labilithrix sp.]